jgi:hypothetical protein
VSIAQTGVLVRKWDMKAGFIKAMLSNFFGPKLYDEGSVYKNAETARALSLMYPEQARQLSFRNPVLAAFSNVIWNCASAAEVCVVLNEAAAGAAQMAPRRSHANSDQSIIAQFADLMAQGGTKPDVFYDEAMLPHSKQDILLAIEREILRESSDERVEWLAVGAAFLPSFQRGVGSKPLPWLGVDLTELRKGGDLREQAKALAQNPDRIRADRFLEAMKIEAEQIQARIEAARRLRKARTRPSNDTRAR